MLYKILYCISWRQDCIRYCYLFDWKCIETIRKNDFFVYHTNQIGTYFKFKNFLGVMKRYCTRDRIWTNEWEYIKNALNKSGFQDRSYDIRAMMMEKSSLKMRKLDNVVVENDDGLPLIILRRFMAPPAYVIRYKAQKKVFSSVDNPYLWALAYQCTNFSHFLLVRISSLKNVFHSGCKVE